MEGQKGEPNMTEQSSRVAKNTLCCVNPFWNRCPDAVHKSHCSHLSGREPHHHPKTTGISVQATTPPPHPHFPPDCPRPLVCSNSGAPFSPVEYMCWIFLISLCDPLRALYLHSHGEACSPVSMVSLKTAPPHFWTLNYSLLLLLYSLLLKIAAWGKLSFWNATCFLVFSRTVNTQSAIITIPRSSLQGA